MVFRDNIPAQSFFSWLIKNRENRILLMLSGVVMIVAYAWFKYIYPLPNLFPDSYEYIQGAIEKRTIDYRPIGYTKFLQFFPFITRSHFWLVTIQYILLQVSLLYMLFSIHYLLQPGKWIFFIILLGSLLNPLIYQVGNFVSSDPIFTTLSLIWFTQLLWIIARPTRNLLFSHAAILFFAFVVRYNAIYFPVISIGAILFSQAPRWLKGVSTALIVVSLGGFVWYTKQQFKKFTGIAQFSPFSGWQQAANALTIYSHTPKLDPIESAPEQFRLLHNRVNQYIDTLHHTKHSPVVESETYFLWKEQSPLRQYMHQEGEKYGITDEFTRWVRMAPLYSAYGNYLIKQHPDLYITYHLFADAHMYFKPHLEYLSVYYSGGRYIQKESAEWFNLPTNGVENNYNSTISSTKYIPSLNGAFILIFILAASCFIVIGGIKNTPRSSNKILGCTLLVLVCNAGFGILAAPIVLRYQTFPFIVTSTFCGVLIAFIIKTYLTIQQLEKMTIKKEPVLTEPETTYQTQPIN